MATNGWYAAELMKHMVTHDGDGGHGYTWGNRWGDSGYEDVWINGRKFTIREHDRDCSSGVISAWEAVDPGCTGGATYTGNMVRCFTSTGKWVKKPMSFLAEPGDVYLNETDHTAMCYTQEPDVLCEFCINENGEVYGGKPGDQTGRESRIASYYDFPWDCILHYVGEGVIDDKPSYEGEGVRYRVHTEASGWLDEMVNDVDTGGSADTFAGDDSPIDAIAMNFEGWYQVQLEDGVWLPPVTGYDLNDDDNGYAGIIGKRIIALRCFCTSGVISYSVNDLPTMMDLVDTGGSSDDFAGDGSLVRRVYAYL